MSELSIIGRKVKAGRRFDPALFFETAAKGRTIAKHRKSEIIFSQDDAANSSLLSVVLAEQPRTVRAPQ